ncbi:MAG: hypothetical protein GF400_06740 [Candidatus Eisenbacteria bacterium]|nr:hypothetical protein [Candidatus Eisenbacteria bacterium]
MGLSNMVSGTDERSRKRGRARGLITNLALVVAACIVTVLVAEALLHATSGIHGIALRRSACLPPVWGPGKGLPWVLRADAVGRQIDGYGEFDCEFRINSLGLRDDEVEPSERPGGTRTLILGDSVTAGHGVEQDETYASQLDEMLGGAGRNEVLNCGWASWYTTDGAYVFLRQRIDEFDPDLVILGFFLNDVADLRPDWWRPTGASLPDSLRPPRGPEDPRSRAPGLFDRARMFLGRRSYLYNLVRERLAGGVRRASRGSDLFTLEHALRGEFPASAVMLFTRDYPPEVQKRLELTERLFVGMDRLCAERGAHFAVAVLPADFQVLDWKRERSGVLPVVFHDQPYVAGKAQKVISEMCRRNGIPVVDLLPAFRERGTDDCFFRWDPHPTALGHTLIAEELAWFIRSEGLLDRPRSTP